MIDIKNVIVYDYWARFVFLRFNDSIEYPIMDFLIEEVGSTNIETMTDIFIKEVLPKIDINFFISRNISFIRNQDYLILGSEKRIIDTIFWVVFRQLYPIYIEMNKIHSKHNIDTINNFFKNYLSIISQQCNHLDDNVSGKNSLLSNIEMWEKNPWY